MISQLQTIINYILIAFFVVAEFFLVGRLFLRMFGANVESPFVAFVYSIAAIFKIPFYGVFSNIPLYENAAIDIVALTAIVGYIFLYLLLSVLLSLFTGILSKTIHLPKQK